MSRLSFRGIKASWVVLENSSKTTDFLVRESDFSLCWEDLSFLPLNPWEFQRRWA